MSERDETETVTMLIDAPGPFAPCERHLEFVCSSLDSYSRHHPQLRRHIRESLLLLRLFKRHGGDRHLVLTDWLARQPQPRQDISAAFSALLKSRDE